MDNNTIYFAMRNSEGLYIANHKGEYTPLLKNAEIFELPAIEHEVHIANRMKGLFSDFAAKTGQAHEAVPLQRHCVYDLQQNEELRNILNLGKR